MLRSLGMLPDFVSVLENMFALKTEIWYSRNKYKVYAHQNLSGAFGALIKYTEVITEGDWITYISLTTTLNSDQAYAVSLKFVKNCSKVFLLTQINQLIIIWGLFNSPFIFGLESVWQNKIISDSERWPFT